MNAQAWVAMCVGIMAILSGLYGMTKFIVKAIMAEIGPKANGSSLKEQINRIERGHADPHLSTVRALSQALGVPLADLVDE